MNNNLWGKDMAAAADLCRLRLPERMAHTLSLADEILCNRFTFRDHWEMERTNLPVEFPGQVDWSTIPADDPEWLYAMNRHTSFVNLGKAYRYTGERRYADKFAELITGWIDNVPLCEETKSTMWRSLEAGLRCENWLRALRLFETSPILTPALCSKINSCLTVHGDYLAVTSNQFHRLSNWGVLQDHGLFLLGIWFARADWCELAVQRLNEQLSLQVMDDGSHWEQSPMYHCEVLHCVIDVLTVARQNSVSLPQEYTARVHRMCVALANWLTPDGRLVCQSDSDNIDARDLLAQGALLFGDGYLRFAAGGELFEENYWDFGTGASEGYAAIQSLPPDHPSTALPDSGNYMLRGDLTADSPFLHLHCGCLGSGHGHADLLHLDLSAYGEDILIDSGRYSYVNTPLRRQLKHPAAHNTTRVDGVDFSEAIDSWGYSRLAQPIKGEYKFTADADYISGSHLGYLPQGVFVTRQIVYLRPRLFVIADSFAAQGHHRYERQFHLGAGSAQLSGDTLHWQGSRAAMSLCCPDADRLSMSRAPYSRVYNSLCEGDLLTAVTAGAGNTHLVTVAAVGSLACAPDLRVTLLPVTTTRLGRIIPPAEAQAVQISLDGEEYLVIFCYAEVISEVDLLTAAGRDGYGKVIVSTPQHPVGRTLVW